MKKSIFLLFLFFTFLAKAQENYQFYMNINFQDCINCIQPIRMFNKIPKSFNPKMVFRKQDERIAKQFLKDKMETEIPSSQIIYSDSLFKTLNGGSEYSFAHIVWKNNPIKSYKLSTFQRRLLEPFTNIQIQTTKILPDSVVLGNDIQLSHSSENLILFDNQFQKIYVLSNKTQMLKYIIEDKSFDRKEVYKQIFGDTTGYYQKITQYEKELRQTGDKYVKLKDVIIKENKIYITISLSYVVDDPKDKNNVFVLSKTIFIEILGAKEYKYYPLLDSPILKNNDYSSMLWLRTASNMQNNHIYTTIFRDNPDSTNTYLVGKYTLKESKDKKKGNSLNFESFTKLKYPKFAYKFRESNMEYRYLAGHIAYPYYFFVFDNSVANLETGETFKVIDENLDNVFKNIGEKKSKLAYYLAHIIKNQNNTYNLFITKGENQYIYNFDATTKKTTLMKEIVIPLDANKFGFIGNYIFTDNKTLLTINSKNETIKVTF
jgi:hypothetical protein